MRHLLLHYIFLCKQDLEIIILSDINSYNYKKLKEINKIISIKSKISKLFKQFCVILNILYLKTKKK